jgi:hypothetical protein
MQPVVAAILDRHFPIEDGDWSPLSVAAALHFYVYHKLPYEKRHEGGTRPFRPPHETWQVGGNCEEKTVTLASLYHAVRTIHTRMVSVTNHQGDGHLLVEMGAEVSRPEATAELNEFYRRLDDAYEETADGVRSYYVTEGEEYTWFPVDPEMGEHVGDGAGLTFQGFIDGRRTDWDWVECNYYVYPEVGRIPA